MTENTDLMDFDREAALASFLSEADESLDLMEQSLLEMDSGSGSADLLNDIFRVAHTIKGNASALDLDDLANLAHTVEDLLDVYREKRALPGRNVISLLLKAVDEFRTLVPEAIAGKEGLTPSQENLQKQIVEAVKRGAVHTSGKRRVPESEAPKEPQKSEISSTAGRTLRADIGKLDQMLNLTSEIVVAQGRMRNLLEKLNAEERGDILEVHQEVERLYMDLQRELMSVRMVPIDPTFRQLKRSVRDISAAHGKVARLETSGGDVELDTTVLEHLRDPLLHMVRNALDHGIETPAVRESRGKDRCGLLKLSAFHSSGRIVIQLTDDGAGFNRAKIQEKARRAGLITENEQLTDQEIPKLIFEAGFSTAQKVTDLSGRGVGLDVVKRNIQALRGTVEVSSEEGKGTVFTIRLPLTLAIIDGLAVSVGEDKFIIPSDYVTECAELTGRGEQDHQGKGILNLRGAALPYVRLREAFRMQGENPARENVVVVKVGELDAGIAVDHVLGGCQAVIKPLGKALQRVAGIAGSTILDDGRVGLIIDVPGLLSELTPSAGQTNLANR
jgi:two-component system, chemotaxis family, sensor kinase CheA